MFDSVLKGAVCVRKQYSLPAFALVCGAIGFILRRWVLATAYEPSTGLPIAGAPAALALFALSALFAVLALIFCQGRHYGFPGGYDEAFYSPSPLVSSVTITAGFLMGAAGILKFMDMLQSSETSTLTAESESISWGAHSNIPTVILCVLCLFSAYCFVLTAKNNYRGERKGARSLPLLIPAYACCAWLITTYEARAGHPFLIDYICELFAIIAVVLALYFIAGFSFEKSKVKRTLFASLLGIYFSCVSLAAAGDLATLLLYTFAVLHLLVSVFVLLKNDRRMLLSGEDSGQVAEDTAFQLDADLEESVLNESVLYSENTGGGDPETEASAPEKPAPDPEDSVKEERPE